MSVNEDLSDDYVAKLLAKDAKASTSRYSPYGLYEKLPKRATNNAPKPNTRFLKNILKETDNHNATLRAKEAPESRSRLRELANDRQKKSHRSHDFGRLRYEDELPGPKRRRVEYDEGLDRKTVKRGAHHHEDGECEGGRSSRQPKLTHYGEELDSKPSDRSGRHRHHHRQRRRRSSRDSLERDRHRTESRSTSPWRHHHRQHYHSRRRRASLSSDSQERKHRSGKSRHNTHPPDEASYSERRGEDLHSGVGCQPHSPDSDPLEAIIGPPPPPPEPKIKFRGRGAWDGKSASAMDDHFLTDYDPATDAHPDPDLETDDWDQALEALRDRQKWQKQGAERLKAAGFTEEEVSKWANGKAPSVSAERGEEDVRWRGRGEGREWDRGKVMTDYGVETGAAWGRLKGN